MEIKQIKKKAIIGYVMWSFKKVKIKSKKFK